MPVIIDPTPEEVAAGQVRVDGHLNAEGGIAPVDSPDRT